MKNIMPNIKKALSIAKISFLVIIFICLNTINQKTLNVFASNILESGKKLYSQYNEELIIRDFFNDFRGGIFVDVGCAHYRDKSTTYYLERHLDWSGVAIDALAEFAIGYRGNRPRTRFCNFIVTDHSGDMQPFYRLIAVTGLSSVSQEYVEKAAEYFGVKKDYQVIYVPTITLTEILEKSGISKIDFLSMDIEGSEPKALSGFDINRFKPRLVCIEAQPSTRDKIFKYFSEHGYVRISKYLKHDKINWYFRPRR